MYNKTIIRFGFCDIQNNQGLGKGYQPQPSASADNSLIMRLLLCVGTDQYVLDSLQFHSVLIISYQLNALGMVIGDL